MTKVKRKAKFKVGQVVGLGDQYARVIKIRHWDGGLSKSFYEYRVHDEDNEFWYGEYDLRPLTPREAGQRQSK
jgi:hypothetical protein